MKRSRLVALAVVLALLLGGYVGWVYMTRAPHVTSLAEVKERAHKVEKSAPTQPDSTVAAPQAVPPTPEASRAYRPHVTVLQAQGREVRVPEGVYAYDTKGSETVHFGPGETHRYPDTTYVRYTPTACGFEAAWEPLQDRSNVYRLCVNPFTLATYDQNHKFFGRADQRKFICPQPLPMADGGHVQCWTDDHSIGADNRVFSTREIYTIEGQQIPVQHVTILAQASGDANGSQHSEWWFSEYNNLLLKATSVISTDAHVLVLGNITYTENVTVKLHSLRPVG
jgi:hypothetical protein